MHVAKHWTSVENYPLVLDLNILFMPWSELIKRKSVGGEGGGAGAVWARHIPQAPRRRRQRAPVQCSHREIIRRVQIKQAYIQSDLTVNITRIMLSHNATQLQKHASFPLPTRPLHIAIVMVTRTHLYLFVTTIMIVSIALLIRLIDGGLYSVLFNIWQMCIILYLHTTCWWKSFMYENKVGTELCCS